MEKQKRAYIYALLAILLWSTVASAFKISLGYLSVLQLLFVASLTATLALLIFLIAKNKLGVIKTYSKKDFLRSALLGILNPFMYYNLLFIAYSLLPAQLVQPVDYTWPIWLVLLSIPLLRQKIRAQSLFAIFICFIGVLVVATQGNLLSLKFTNAFATLSVAVAAVVWALFWIYNIKDKREEVPRLFLSFAFGFVYITIAMLLFSSVPKLDTTTLIAGVYVGLFEMGVTFVIWSTALKLSKTTAHISSLIYLVPFLSLIFIHFVVGETILPSTFIGLVLVVGGIIIQTHYQKIK